MSGHVFIPNADGNCRCEQCLPTQPPCPECGMQLDRRQDPLGVTFQCLQMDCLSFFEEGEITQ